MTIKKRGFASDVDQHTDHRWGNDPADQHPEWLEIYGKLKAAIGEWPAYNWFGRCRFIGRRDGLIILENWGAFVADECLKMHGFDLCIAAQAQRAEVRYSGGFRPAHLQGPIPSFKSGSAKFSMPPVKNIGGGFVENAIANTRPPRPAPRFKYQMTPVTEGGAFPARQLDDESIRGYRSQNPMMADAMRDAEARQAAAQPPAPTPSQAVDL